MGWLWLDRLRMNAMKSRTSWGNVVINAIELEGLEPIYVAGTSQDITKPDKPILTSSTHRTIEFFLKHLYSATVIGSVAPKGTNISSNASRFATRGVDAESNSILNKNSYFDEKDEGSQIGAFRHVLWQAIIRKQLGYNIAKEAGDAHEENPNTDLTKRIFDANQIADADQVVDLLNNKIGREIGRKNPNSSTKNLALKTLEAYREIGFYSFIKNDNGMIEIIRTKITEEQYDQLKTRINELDNTGKTQEEVKADKPNIKT